MSAPNMDNLASENPYTQSEICWQVSFQFHHSIYVWNSLPVSLQNLPTLSEFKAQLKPFIFQQAFL